MDIEQETGKLLNACQPNLVPMTANQLDVLDQVSKGPATAGRGPAHLNLPEKEPFTSWIPRRLWKSPAKKRWPVSA